MDPLDRVRAGSLLNLHDEPATIDWEPSGVVTSMWVSLSIMLGALAFFLFGFIFALIGASPVGEDFTFNWIAVAALTLMMLVLHQLTHAGIARLAGGRPRLDVDVIHWIFPALYCCIVGQQFSRIHFMAYSVGPLVLPSFVIVALMPFDERTAMLIIPLAVNASFSIRDVWMAWIVWRQPPGTIVEARRNGLRLIRAI